MTELVSLLGDGQHDPLADALRMLRKSVDLFIEHAELTAKIRRAKYLALIDAGFTKEEALELCKASPF